MASLNYDKLVSMVDDFLAPFGLDSDFDSDFAYDMEEERVYFTIMFTERSDRLFSQYIKKTFNFDVPNIFIISLLHEVGHAETLDGISRRSLKADHKIKDSISLKLDAMSHDDPLYDKIYSEYFDLNVEKVATAWAVDYYKMNQKRCDDFYFKFENALVQEYKRLNLELN